MAVLFGRRIRIRIRSIGVFGIRRGFGFVAYALFLGALASAALFLITLPSTNSTSASFILALALLPLTNALFDWASYGTTIWLLRWGTRLGKGWALVMGLLDAAAALVFFGLLSCFLVVLFGGIDAARDVPLIDVGRTLAALRFSPNEHLWLIAMVASTLVPTLLHLCLAILSLTMYFPRNLWTRYIAQLTPNGSETIKTWFTGLMATIVWLYFVLPVAGITLIFWALWTHGGTLRESYVDMLIRFATYTGVI